jgi:hypothetical protein
VDEGAALRLGYAEDDLARLRALSGGPLERPEEIRRVLDALGYEDDWRSSYHVRSVRSSLASARVTCIDAAVLSYGLMELFPGAKRRLLAIHRMDPASGEECGHVVTLFWGEGGKVGAFSKSSFPGLGHRDATFEDEIDLATSYAEAYLRISLVPLYFGVTTLEEAAPDVDWRLSPDNLEVLSERIQRSYAYAFGT